MDRRGGRGAGPASVTAMGGLRGRPLLAEAAELGRQGRYTPPIERTYPFERLAEAHAHAERGRIRGKVAVRV